MSDIGRVLKIKDDTGAIKRHQMYVTQDVVLKKGDTIFFNDLEESFAKKVEYNLISVEESTERLGKIRARDVEFNRETAYVCRLGKRKTETEGL